MITFAAITKDNWEEVIRLTTNADGIPTLGETFLASNAYSLVQSRFEKDWVSKAILADGLLVGFAMYGFWAERGVFELCRFMLDRRFQGKGLGQQALPLLLAEIEKAYGCNEIYLTTDPKNARGIHLYQKFGFQSTGEILRDSHGGVEEIFRLKL